MPITSGPRTAKIMIVGEAPGKEEIEQRRPFVGQSGHLLTSMLLEVGINRNDCYITNVCHDRPPGNDIDLFFHKKTEAKSLGLTSIFGLYPNQSIRDGLDLLRADILEIKPSLIIAFGGTALWALTGNQAIMNWRGSALYYEEAETGTKIPLLPTIHPANILRDWSSRFLCIQDLRRGADVLGRGDWPRRQWEFVVQPTLDKAIAWLNHQLCQLALVPTSYSVDIETRGGQIACVGIGRNSAAICIPFMRASAHDGNYWGSTQEELAVTRKLQEFLTHPNMRAIFHNGAYDLQYFAKQWGFLPRLWDDTMIMQHVAYPGLRKSLAMCSSLYCEYHRYWKDDGKEWTKDMNEEQLWTYNCEDCIRTYEIKEVLEGVLSHLGVVEQYEFQCRELFPEVLRTMLRGVPIDFQRRMEMDLSLSKMLEEHQDWLTTSVGHPINPRSPKKMQELFYVDLGVPVRRNRKTGKPSLDDEAMTKIAKHYPLLAPLVQKILDFRSIGVFLSTFVRAEVPPDGNMRCTYNITGTETFRFSSSADSFDYGTNLQNIPSGDE
jgi:DNA polymerase